MDEPTVTYDLVADGPVDLFRAYLVVRDVDRTHVVELEDGADVVLGRAPDADVVIADARVSRRHARFSRRDRRVVVRDEASHNATVVNATPVSDAERVLEAGDVVRLGPVEVVVAVTAGWANDIDESTDIVLAEPTMLEVFARVRRVAKTTTTVLVLGETGVGKEVVAEHVHRWSPRAARPFVALNCASLPENLLESELFGHEKGAFTGATARKLGYFESAEGGTLFLDEIGELAPQLQAKLLRVLETRTVTPLGSTRSRQIDVRIVAATHRDLAARVAQGLFREDLYYRLDVFSLEIPPLRRRRAEIALLADRFARSIAREVGAPPPRFDALAMTALFDHAWPGNVRELRNAIEHAVILADDGVIRVGHLPPTVLGKPAAEPPASREGMRGRVADLEKASIRAALDAANGNVSRAATQLGLSRGALLYKLQKYGLR